MGIETKIEWADHTFNPWKGGTTGHAINMLSGELHEAAFRRYCAENNMTFVSVALTPVSP